MMFLWVLQHSCMLYTLMIMSWAIIYSEIKSALQSAMMMKCWWTLRRVELQSVCLCVFLCVHARALLIKSSDSCTYRTGRPHLPQLWENQVSQSCTLCSVVEESQPLPWAPGAIRNEQHQTNDKGCLFHCGLTLTWKGSLSVFARSCMRVWS